MVATCTVFLDFWVSRAFAVIHLSVGTGMSVVFPFTIFRTALSECWFCFFHVHMLCNGCDAYDGAAASCTIPLVHGGAEPRVQGATVGAVTAGVVLGCIAAALTVVPDILHTSMYMPASVPPRLGSSSRTSTPIVMPYAAASAGGSGPQVDLLP